MVKTLSVNRVKIEELRGKNYANKPDFYVSIDMLKFGSS